MNILFQKEKDKEICNNEKLLRKQCKGNPRRHRRIRARRDLAVMRYIPMAYCHELKGKRKGKLAVKLDQGLRLTFEPANDPIPQKADGGLDWSQVTAIRIIKIAEDYHD